MSYENRVSFQKTYESPNRDNDRGEPDSTVWRHQLMCGGAISVQHRKTGYGYGAWDEETAYMSPCGGFWLACGGVDVRDYLHRFNSEEGMIEWVMRLSNTCDGTRAHNPGTSLEGLNKIESRSSCAFKGDKYGARAVMF